MFYAFEGTVIEEEIYLNGSPTFSWGMYVSISIIGLFEGWIHLHRFILALLVHIVAGCFVAYVLSCFGLHWTSSLLIAGATQIPVGFLCHRVHTPPP